MRSLMTKSSTISWACCSVRRPAVQVALEVDVQERRGAAQRHRGAVLLLDGGQVGEVEPLDGLAGGAGRAGDVEPVARGHLLQFFERANLLAEFLAVADDLLGGHHRVEAAASPLPSLDQPRDAVERHAAVVADDPPAAVGVGQPGEDVRAAAGPHVGGVGVEDALVVRLAVLGERLDDVRVRLVAVGLERVRTMRKPPLGMMARLSGASVCRPTMISLSLSM